MNRNEGTQDFMPGGTHANFIGMANQQGNMAGDNIRYMPELAGKAAVQYPEVYYKLQPHIMMICDQMDAYGMAMTKDIADNTANKLHGDILRIHPEMTELDNGANPTNTMPEASAAINYGPGYDRYGGYSDYGSRRRGVLRDLIDILLLTEYYRRRRHPYY